MPDSSTQVAATYNGLTAAYAKAHEEADGLDTANRELVHHVLAGSTKAVANRLVMRNADQALVTDANERAAAAASEDRITDGMAIMRTLGKVLVPSGLLAGAITGVVFLLGVLTNLWESSQEAGAGFVRLLLSGGVTGGLLYFIARGIAMAGQAAPAAGSGIADAFREAFGSADPAKKVLAQVYAAERVFFGGSPPMTAQRLVIAGTGPVVAGLLALLIAFPLVMIAGGITGAFSGADNPYDTTPNFPTGPTGPP